MALSARFHHLPARLLAVLLLSLPVTVVFPADIRLEAQVLQESQVASAGKVGQTPALVPATRVTSGSEVIYQVSYTNVGKQAATVVITNPLPSELAFQQETLSFTGARLEVSVDGGAHFGSLAELRIKGYGGQTRAAETADITHVRWVLDKPVEPGQGGEVSLRARVR